MKLEVKEQNDYVADIMQQLYDETYKNGASITPKVSTIIGTILAKYEISLKTSTRDIWAEAMTIKGGDFPTWYSSLNDSEKLEYEKGRQRASELHDPRNKKTLLKG